MLFVLFAMKALADVKWKEILKKVRWCCFEKLITIWLWQLYEWFLEFEYLLS